MVDLPRAYLLTGAGAICPGPGDGTRCASCVGSTDTGAHHRRLEEIRARAASGLTSILAVSDAVRRTLLAAGYPADMVDVVRQAMPHESEIWGAAGRDRAPGRRGPQLTVAFLGSAYQHKGPQLLVEAAQRARAEIRVKIIGEVPESFAQQLRRLDKRGVVELTGSFAPSEISTLLRDVDAVALPSMWWDCAPLAAAECHAARVPLLVPRLGGLPETVADGIDGLLFDALDADDLARAIDRLASEDGLLERLQAAIGPPAQFAGYVDTLERYYAGERPGQAVIRAANGSIAADATVDAASACVRWQGDHGLPSSLAIINDRVSERLPGPVQLVGRGGIPVSAPLPHPADVEVHHQWPPDLTPAPAGALAAIVPWEFGSVPRIWVEQINRDVDELWVPSEYVRQMYVDGGVPAERVRAIPNGVDLERFHPRGAEPADSAGMRFLFVGGLIWRKGPDLLLEAWKRAFSGRDDVTLVVKDFGADGVYRGDGFREPIAAHARSGALPRIELLQENLSEEGIAELFRSANVLVHPYRGEGFAMPVLEAMASGLPVITTAGGPTDEFCPPEAGWRIRARRKPFAAELLGELEPVDEPWMLEPDVEHLVELLREAAADAVGRQARGRAARAAAEQLSWDAVAARYAERIAVLANVTPRVAAPDVGPFPFSEAYGLRLLATPAWRGSDGLAELLCAWSSATTRDTDACLYLLADPATAGAPEEIERFVVEAAARGQADLESCADIDVLMEPLQADRDRRLFASVDGYVTLHGGCEGYARMARAAGAAVLRPEDRVLSELLAPVRAQAARTVSPA